MAQRKPDKGLPEAAPTAEALLAGYAHDIECKKAENQRLRHELASYKHKLKLAHGATKSRRGLGGADGGSPSPPPARDPKLGTGVSTRQTIVHFQEVTEAFRVRGVFATDVMNNLCAGFVSHQGLESSVSFVKSLDVRLKGKLFQFFDNQVVAAIQAAFDVRTCHTAKMLFDASNRAWDAGCHALFKIRDNKDEYWIPRVVQVAPGRQINMPQPVYKTGITTWEKNFFFGMKPTQSDDHKSVCLDVFTALRRCFSRAEKDIKRPEGAGAGGNSSTNSIPRIHLSGDAARYASNRHAAMLVARAIGDGFTFTQTPHSLSLLLYMMGKDSYTSFLKFGATMWNQLREVASSGLHLLDEQGVDEACHHDDHDSNPVTPVDFELGGDWVFLMEVWGLMSSPRTSYPCPLCKIHRKDLGKWRCGAGDRTILEQCHLAHCVMPETTTDNFVPFTCPSKTCKKHFPTLDSVLQEHGPMRADYARNHFGQEWKRRPLFAGVVKRVVDITPCVLHMLLALTKANFDGAVRYPASYDINRCNKVNDYNAQHDLLFRPVELEDTTVAPDWKNGKNKTKNVIGAQCIKFLYPKHWEAQLDNAWSPNDVEDNPDDEEAWERAAQYGMWWNCMGKLCDLWGAVCTPTIPSDFEDYKKNAANLDEKAKAYFDAFKYTSDDEHVRFYHHITEHLQERVEEHGNLLNRSGEATEHMQHVMKRLALKHGNWRVQGMENHSGKEQWGLAALLATKFVGLQDAQDNDAASTKKHAQEVRRTTTLWSPEMKPTWTKKPEKID
jgi:hypothetical protein